MTANTFSKFKECLRQFWCIRTRGTKGIFMTTKTEKTLAWQDKGLKGTDLLRCKIDLLENSELGTNWQVSKIAKRYNLSLHRAKLVSELSGLGVAA